LLSRRGRSLPANASGFDTHRDSISSRFDCTRSSSGGWFRIYNVLSELDHEGEYIIDSFGESLLLLVIPPAAVSLPNAVGRPLGAELPDLVLSMSTMAVLHVHDTHDVHFRGIDVLYGRAWGAVFDDCDDCGLSNALVANFGINAVNVSGNCVMQDHPSVQ
jgi:hypothetical protein